MAENNQSDFDIISSGSENSEVSETNSNDTQETQESQTTEATEESPDSEGTEESEKEESEDSEDIDKELEDFDKEKTEVEETEEDKRISREVRRPSFKKILQKYPNITKEFPEFRHVFFSEQKFREICGTVEDAKDMSEKSQLMDAYQNVISSGKMDVFVKALNENESEKFAEGFLPALASHNPNLFRKATRPILVELLNRAYKSSEDKNMQISVLNVCQYIFGKRELPKHIEEAVDPEIEKQKAELNKERNRIASEKYNTYRGGIQEFIDNKLSVEILGRLDDNLTDAHKQAIVNSVLDSIDEELRGDNFHMSSINSFWRRAEKDGLNPEWRSKIISAYLGRARQSLESHIKQYAAKKRAKSENSEVPQRSNGSARNTASSSTKVDPKNFKRTSVISDLDIIKS